MTQDELDDICTKHHCKFFHEVFGKWYCIVCLISEVEEFRKSSEKRPT